MTIKRGNAMKLFKLVLSLGIISSYWVYGMDTVTVISEEKSSAIVPLVIQQEVSIESPSERAERQIKNLNLLLKQEKYTELYRLLDQAVVQRDFTTFNWAFSTMEKTLYVPLLHWTIFHELSAYTSMPTEATLAAILKNMLFVLVCAKVDEIVCYQMDGKTAGRSAYGLLRKQYNDLLVANRLQEQAGLIDFEELCQDVFCTFECEELVESELRDTKAFSDSSGKKASRLVSDDEVRSFCGTPMWVCHVAMPKIAFLTSFIWQNRVMFGDPTEREISWTFNLSNSVWISNKQDLLIRDDIFQERKKVFIKFKTLIAEKKTWAEFMATSFDDLREVA